MYFFIYFFAYLSKCSVRLRSLINDGDCLPCGAAEPHQGIPSEVRMDV